MSVPADGDGPSIGVRRMWGIASQTPANDRPRLSVESIVGSAVGIADRDGLDAVSMSRVAADLGYTTMALYRHVTNKDELLEMMLDRAIGRPPDPAGQQWWRDEVSSWAWDYLAVFPVHPWMSQIPAAGFPVGPNGVAWVEAGLVALRGSGLGVLERFGVVDELLGLVRHHGTRAGGVADRSQSRSHVYGRQLARVIGPDGFPELVQLIAAGSAVTDDHATPDAGGATTVGSVGTDASSVGTDASFARTDANSVREDADFDFGLRLLLDGVELLARRRR